MDPISERLRARHPQRIDLSLERMRALCAALDDPQHRLPPVIHVAGTNGKGSTVAFIRAIAEAARRFPPISIDRIWPSTRGRSARTTTRSTMPFSCRYSARWKPGGSFSRMVASMTRGPAKPIRAPGSARCTSPSMA